MTPRRRRQAGEGSISEYQTKAGPRFLIKYGVTQPDGSRKQVLQRGCLTRKEAATKLREKLREVERGEWVQPSKQRLDAYLTDWIAGKRLAPGTLQSYAKNVRLHIAPRLGATPLASLTGAAIDRWMRDLEREGRADGTGGLSARTVRYVYTILREALSEAVRQGVLATNPTDRATPPSPSQTRAPEMRVWTAEQLADFLTWCTTINGESALAWRMLAVTGMRRGELLALRWRDIDFDRGTVEVRRSLSIIQEKGQPAYLHEGATKTGRSRKVELDPETLAGLRSYRAQRGALALDLAREDSVAFGKLDGSWRNPTNFSRLFVDQLTRGRRELGADALPMIRLHDLRHTHASLLLADGVPVKVVSERLGHASPTITLSVYQHVLPGMGRQAADRFAALLGPRSIEAVSRGGSRPSRNETPSLLTSRNEGASAAEDGRFELPTADTHLGTRQSSNPRPERGNSVSDSSPMHPEASNYFGGGIAPGITRGPSDLDGTLLL